MQLTTQEALDLLRRLSDDVGSARSALRDAEQRRDAVIRALDGQSSPTRQAMADACGVTKSAIHFIVGRQKPEREQLADGVPMDDRLYRQLVDVVGGFARQVKGSDSVRFDVDA